MQCIKEIYKSHKWHRTKAAAQQWCSAPKIKHTIDALHHICSSPKTHYTKDASRQRCIRTWMHHTQFIGCSVTNRGHRSIYIDSDAGGKRRLGVLRHEDREVFAWVRFFAWISKCPSGHCYFWFLDWSALLVKFSRNIRFSWWMFLGKAKQLQRSFTNSQSPNVIKQSLCWGSRRIVIYNQLGCSSSGGHKRAMSGPT